MRASCFLFMTLATTPAFAAASAWVELVPEARARLVTADTREADGSVLAGIEIDMPASFKTYWKTPGETGLPTVLDFSASTGLAGHRVLWPYPVIDKSQGYLDYVYPGSTVLPVALMLDGDAAMLDVTATLGICSDICAPASARFALPLSLAAPDPGQSIRLRQAAALAPLAWTSGPEPVGDIALAEDGKSLTLRVTDTGIDAASLIAATDDPADVFGTPQKSPEPGIFLLPLLGSNGIKGLEGKPVQITFLTAAGPFQVSRHVLPAASPAN
jgi:DsbC/DsbD-like thiol-disulfide interchange protein